MLIAAVGLRALLGAAPADLPGVAGAAINVRVLALAFLVTAAAGLLVCVLPVLGTRATERLNRGVRGGVAERATRRTHGALVVSEVALAATLVSAGLLIRSFATLAGIDAGFRQDHVLTLSLSVPADGYAGRAEMLSYFDEVERRVAALPGVAAVSAVDRLPFGPSASRIPVEAGSAGPAPGAASTALNLTARPGYFESMEIPLLQGRSFDPQDAIGRQPSVIVSQELARRLWPGGDVLGQHLTAFGQTLDVVGVVGDVRHFGPAVAPEPMLYFSHATDPFCAAA